MISLALSVFAVDGLTGYSLFYPILYGITVLASLAYVFTLTAISFLAVPHLFCFRRLFAVRCEIDGFREFLKCEEKPRAADGAPAN